MSNGAEQGKRPASIAELPAPGTRSASQIRADIVAQREQLGGSVDQLRGRVNEITDWRTQAKNHQRQITMAAAAAGLLIGGAILLGRRGGGE